jgi:hypothetical protein
MPGKGDRINQGSSHRHSATAVSSHCKVIQQPQFLGQCIFTSRHLRAGPGIQNTCSICVEAELVCLC